MESFFFPSKLFLVPWREEIEPALLEVSLTTLAEVTRPLFPLPEGRSSENRAM